MVRLTNIAVLLASVALTSCATMSDTADQLSGLGKIEDRVSEFDGARTISSQPTHLQPLSGSMTGPYYRLGASWTSKAPETIALVFMHSSSIGSGNAYTNFKRVDINAGGQVTSFEMATATALDNSSYNSVSKTIYTQSTAFAVLPLDYARGVFSNPDCKMRIVSSDAAFDADCAADRTTAGQATGALRVREVLGKIPAP